MPRRPKNELVVLARAAKAQLDRARALGASLDERLAAKRKVAPDWIPDEDWRRDFASVTQTIQHTGTSLIRALEGNKKDLGNLTEAQLEAQFKEELVRSAQSMTDDDWARMIEARNKRNE